MEDRDGIILDEQLFEGDWVQITMGLSVGEVALIKELGKCDKCPHLRVFHGYDDQHGPYCQVCVCDT